MESVSEEPMRKIARMSGEDSLGLEISRTGQKVLEDPGIVQELVGHGADVLGKVDRRQRILAAMAHAEEFRYLAPYFGFGEIPLVVDPKTDASLGLGPQLTEEEKEEQDAQLESIVDKLWDLNMLLPENLRSREGRGSPQDRSGFYGLAQNPTWLVGFLHRIIENSISSIISGVNKNRGSNLELPRLEHESPEGFTAVRCDLPLDKPWIELSLLEMLKHTKKLESMEIRYRQANLKKKPCIDSDLLMRIVSRNEGLEVLSLQGLRLGKVLGGSIGMLGHLTDLDLVAVDVEKLPDSIGSLKLLKNLELNNLYYLTELPASIGNMENLERLKIRDVSALTALPASIGNLKLLKYLSVRGSKLLTALPESIGNLQQLEELDISNTAVTELPDLSRLGKLRTLDIRGLNLSDAARAQVEALRQRGVKIVG